MGVVQGGALGGWWEVAGIASVDEGVETPRDAAREVDATFGGFGAAAEGGGKAGGKGVGTVEKVVEHRRVLSGRG
ncbi:hypothetical protein [Azospirillum canadense]|uniref:hypothetical protein n=1 Tax=Azospirillum canadense TaxID=403962 RepID=UPI002227D8C7|nr:hypothetical protein [Azospirillum canadense]MCW2240730.1 hypothetical protein [Azospirillum canadense]